MSEIRDFFEAYGGSFAKGAAAIAAFYGEPCITARAGTVRLNTTRKDTESFFAGVDANYRDRGFRQGAMLSFAEQSLGVNSAVATIRWAYRDGAGETLWESTFSYNLYRQGGNWRILLQTMHDR
ncbi:MAG: hypothetical protein ACT4P3_08215 [Betaproteobacteria bacterium]